MSSRKLVRAAQIGPIARSGDTGAVREPAQRAFAPGQEPRAAIW